MSDEIVFGIHAVNSLLKRAPERISEMYVQKGRDDERFRALFQLASSNGLRIQEAKKAFLDNLAEGGNHQGVAVKSKQAQAKKENELYKQLDGLSENAFLLVLDSITDPHNLGACLRSADAAGVHAVIAPKDNAVGLTATVSKVACGAAESVPYYQVTNLARTLKELQGRGIWLYGTAGEASDSVFNTDLRGPIAIVMGAEGKGLRRLTRESCDHLINIPMAGDVSSLNVSVAGGICLFEAVRQRSC
ncbi:MAG: 23S rRNA (guanosine(2251)-2'-O)-methyltransferase RlmB [Bermanella sp.]